MQVVLDRGGPGRPLRELPRHLKTELAAAFCVLLAPTDWVLRFRVLPLQPASSSHTVLRTNKMVNNITTPPPAFSLDGDVAIVTGAGSRMPGEIGNGRATAILLARQGAKVALVDFNSEWATETKRMIDEEGGISEVIQADVTSEDSCRQAVAKTVELYGAVHILVNIGSDGSSRLLRHLLTQSCRTVGVGGALGNATTIDLDAWERDFRINVTSMVLMARFAIPEMRKVGRGAIVNMSSVSGRKERTLSTVLLV